MAHLRWFLTCHRASATFKSCLCRQQTGCFRLGSGRDLALRCRLLSPYQWSTSRPAPVAVAHPRLLTNVTPPCKNKSKGYYGWTDDEIAKLRAFKSAGLSARDIGTQFGRSIFSIERALATHGLAKKRTILWSPENLAKLRQMRSQGFHAGYIAQEFGISWNHVNNTVHRYIKPVDEMKDLTGDRIDKICELRRSKRTPDSIATEVGCGVRCVLLVLRDSGLSQLPWRSRELWSAEDIQRARQLRQQGYTYRRIGETFDRSTESVKQMLTKHSLPSLPACRLWAEREDKQLLRLRKQGLTFQAIAQHFKERTRSAVEHRFGKLKHGLAGVDGGSTKVEGVQSRDASSSAHAQ